MTLTIIAVCISVLYTLALCKAAAHIAHPGWRRKRNRRTHRLAHWLAVSGAVK